MRGWNPRREPSRGAPIFDTSCRKRLFGNCAAGEYVVPYKVDFSRAVDVTSAGRNLDELWSLGLLLCYKPFADFKIANIYRRNLFSLRIQLFPEVFAESERNVGMNRLSIMSVSVSSIVSSSLS